MKNKQYTMKELEDDLLELFSEEFIEKMAKAGKLLAEAIMPLMDIFTKLMVSYELELAHASFVGGSE